MGLLALVPIVFSRVTEECFEIPQSALLTTGALLLVWRALAGELQAVARSGPGRYLRAAGARLKSWGAGDPLGVGVLLFLASAIASTIASPNPGQSLHGAPDSTAGLVAASSTAVVYFASRAASRGQLPTLVRYARAAGFASAVASSYALIQLAGLDPFVWGRTATYEGDVRIFGTLGHPNMLGAYLVMTTPLTVWLAGRTRSAAERVLWALVATASVVVIAATLSRGAWIGLFAGAVAWGVLSLLARARGKGGGGSRGPRRASSLPAAAGASVLVLALAVFAFAHSSMGAHLAERVRQIASLSAPTTQSRLHIWRAGLRMAHDSPWLGVGLDAFGTAFPRYRTVEYWNIEWGHTPSKAHNEPIQILATQGIAGGIAALVVLLFAALAIRRRVSLGDGAARMGAIAVGASLTGFAAQDLASFTVVSIGSLAAALVGWLTSEDGATASGRREAAARPRRRRIEAWTRALATIPVAVLFVLLVIRPVRAQIYEKAAVEAPPGSRARAQALERAASDAPWDPRYPNMLVTSLLVESARESNATRSRDLLQRASAVERAAITSEPENSYYYLNLGLVVASQALLRPPAASIAEVKGAFAEAIARDSVNAQIMDQATNALMQVGAVGDARSIALKSARLYPRLAQPMGFFGYAALVDHRWKDAADTLELAVRREWWGEKTARAATWSNLSAAWLALGRNEEARRAAEEALQLVPSNSDAEANRSLAQERLDAAAAAGGNAGARGRTGGVSR